MRNLFLILFLLCVCSGTKASPADHVNFQRCSTGLSSVALNGAAATRTLTLYPNAYWSDLKLGIAYTYNAASAVTVTFSCSFDGTTFYVQTSRSISAGTSTVSDFVDSNAVSGNESFLLEFDIVGCKGVKFVVAGTGSPNANDIVSTQCVVTSGG